MNFLRQVAGLAEGVTRHVLGEHRIEIVCVEASPEGVRNLRASTCRAVASGTFPPVDTLVARALLTMVTTQGVSVVRAAEVVSAVAEHDVIALRVTHRLSATPRHHHGHLGGSPVAQGASLLHVNAHLLFLFLLLFALHFIALRPNRFNTWQSNLSIGQSFL